MTVFVLSVIYLTFISLGLPDSILGVSLPVMQQEWGIPLSYGGAVSMTVVGCTIISSFSGSFIIKKIGTGKVTFFSCLMTAFSLYGFSVSSSFLWLILLAVPLGLGGGAVDAALNNYAALHFKAHHMNWLHSFWGVGATFGPVLMSYFIASSASWQFGYRAVSLIQIVMAAIIFLSLPFWEKNSREKGLLPTRILSEKKGGEAPTINCFDDDREKYSVTGKKTDRGKACLFKIKGVKYAFLTFLLYCTVEHSVGLWGSSYLVKTRNVLPEEGAFWMAFYYGGITAGRMLSGFLSFVFNNRQMIRGGLVTAVAGTLFLFFPFPVFITGGSFVLIGLGLSPVFPAMLHETPARFGKERSQDIIGFQMGFGYSGSAFLPLLLGVLLQHAGMSVFPFFTAFSTVLILFFSERIDRVIYKETGN